MKKNLFNQVQLKRLPRSVFDLSHDVKMSLNMGKLYPTLALECVPGDKFNISCESLLRFAPLVAPVMHRMDVFMHYFFVPTRLLWDGWEDYITDTPYDGVKPAHPFITLETPGFPETPQECKDLSYFGFPYIEYAEPVNVNPFPFAAYQKIYNDYYRDQNLIPEVPVGYELINGDNTANIAEICGLKRRAWEHDYLTSALPFAQKGNAVDIPLGNVILNPTPLGVEPIFRPSSTHTGTLAGTVIGDTFGELNVNGQLAVMDPAGTLGVEPTTINDLRRAFRLQEWFEKQARGGSRYIEVILAHFGVKSSDARLQRPEYITGSKSPVSISEVLNSTGEDGGLPQGNMAGHGVSVTTGNYGKYYCEEHGYIIGIMSVMPKTAYQDGIHKMYLKIDDKFEYYWEEFANIGEQAIQNVEVNAQHVDPTGTFGYIPRYAEYKFMNSRTAGDFQTTLNYWTLTRRLDENTALNAEFINSVPSDDIFAVTDATVDKLYAHVYHKIRAVRPMPFYGTPTF